MGRTCVSYMWIVRVSRMCSYVCRTCIVSVRGCVAHMRSPHGISLHSLNLESRSRVTHMNASSHTHEKIMSLTRKTHVTHTKKPCHWHGHIAGFFLNSLYVVSMCYVTDMKESRHTHEWVMSHTSVGWMAPLLTFFISFDILRLFWLSLSLWDFFISFDFLHLFWHSSSHLVCSSGICQSCHTCPCIMSHVWLSHTYEWVMSHIRMSHVTHMPMPHSVFFDFLYLVSVMSHISMSHVTRVNESHTWMSHGTHMNESWHTREWVMGHMWMSHVIRMHPVRQIHKMLYLYRSFSAKEPYN